MSMILFIFFLISKISVASSLKKNTKVKLNLIADISMLVIVEKVIRGRICHAVHQYVKADNKYMKKYDKNKESLYLRSWDINNSLIGNVTKVACKLILIG